MTRETHQTFERQSPRSDEVHDPPDRLGRRRVWNPVKILERIERGKFRRTNSVHIIRGRDRHRSHVEETPSGIDGTYRPVHSVRDLWGDLRCKPETVICGSSGRSISNAAILQQMGHHTVKLWLALSKSGFLRNVIEASAHAAKKAIGLLRKAAQSRSDSQKRKPVEVRIAPEPAFAPFLDTLTPLCPTPIFARLSHHLTLAGAKLNVKFLAADT